MENGRNLNGKRALGPPKSSDARQNPCKFQKALCRTRTDDPFLTMEGSGFYERSRTLSNGHEIPANSHNLECTAVVADFGRCGSSGRGVDALHSPVRASESPGLTRVPAGPAAADLWVRPMRADQSYFGSAANEPVAGGG